MFSKDIGKIDVMLAGLICGIAIVISAIIGVSLGLSASSGEKKALQNKIEQLEQEKQEPATEYNHGAFTENQLLLNRLNIICARQSNPDIAEACKRAYGNGHTSLENELFNKLEAEKSKYQIMQGRVEIICERAPQACEGLE